jgi:hypothetical protein
MTTTTIERAGYGEDNRTFDCTSQVKALYNRGQRQFKANNNDYGGDPAPGDEKCLYIFWQEGSGEYKSGVTAEGWDGINIP